MFFCTSNRQDILVKLCDIHAEQYNILVFPLLFLGSYINVNFSGCEMRFALRQNCLGVGGWMVGCTVLCKSEDEVAVPKLLAATFASTDVSVSL